jgi:hypothetical protein
LAGVAERKEAREKAKADRLERAKVDRLIMDSYKGDLMAFPEWNWTDAKSMLGLGRRSDWRGVDLNSRNRTGYYCVDGSPLTLRTLDNIYLAANEVFLGEPVEKIWLKHYSRKHMNPRWEAAKLERSIQRRIGSRLRTRYGMALMNYTSKGAGSLTAESQRVLGCSLSFYKLYLEQRFQEGMRWDNWSRDGWHIDHIVPISSFDLRKKRAREKAFHYTNTVPMWAGENLRKSAKVAKQGLLLV